MFIGHFGLAFGAKRIAPRVSLGATIFAAEFLDAVWPVLLLVGVERVEIKPGITRVTPLDFVYYPWSHSLAMAFVWGALFALAYWLLRRRVRDAVILGLLVVSHWVLDWVTHRPDLPLYPTACAAPPCADAERYGLGLWNSLPGSLAIEFALFGAGVYLYIKDTRPIDATGTLALWALIAVLVLSYLGAVFGPPPPSVHALALTSFAGYLMALWGWWIDRHRAPVGTFG
jgi:hypothetical protein